MIIKLEVCGETRLFNHPEDVFECIGQTMGRDVQNFLLTLNKTEQCTGECDETYRIEEHYQRMIRDFVDELDLLLKNKQVNRLKLEQIKDQIMKGL